MMQITEDTPPDMLAGAMDLTVHLPTGKTVKMSVERSTPMMDVLVQITTMHRLQLSEHTVQALEMAPTPNHSDRILPYKPNTPIGVLDTQHVKVVRKNRSLSTKGVAPKPQPFESTFRLQVHLPRNQLYVIRVSQCVLLDDIMRKVCDEKNLDATKYEFRHPGNLDEVLNLKLTLSDYQITEVYVVSKGTVGHSFSTNDIMALRKEEERKQQARTGGGVFSLIFKRGKANMGSGSLSSENRSISPSHSDDSRSVTPPAIQPSISTPSIDKPKPPQRKRRPAPKPPQRATEENEKANSQISTTSDTPSDLPQQQQKKEPGLTICHSRNSSDSSGYHEPSVLSEQCNTSLPRRPKSEMMPEFRSDSLGEHSRSSGNLSNMSIHSKSTTSLTSRKKKLAPPPPPKNDPPVKVPENASPAVVASLATEDTITPILRRSIGKSNPRALRVDVPQPLPRTFKTDKIIEEDHQQTVIDREMNINELAISSDQGTIEEGKTICKEEDHLKVERVENEELKHQSADINEKVCNVTNNTLLIEGTEVELRKKSIISDIKGNSENSFSNNLKMKQNIIVSPDEVNDFKEGTIENDEPTIKNSFTKVNVSKLHLLLLKPHEKPIIKFNNPRASNIQRIRSSNTFSEDYNNRRPTERLSAPSIVALIPKTDSMSSFDSFSSLYPSTPCTPEQSFLNDSSFSTPGHDVDFAIFKSTFKRSISVTPQTQTTIKKVDSNFSITSLNNLDDLSAPFTKVKKWNNVQDLNRSSVSSDKGLGNWVLGDNSDEESVNNPQNSSRQEEDVKPPTTPSSVSELSSRTPSENEDQHDFNRGNDVSNNENLATDTKNVKDSSSTLNCQEMKSVEIPPQSENQTTSSEKKQLKPFSDSTESNASNTKDDDDFETDWQYQLPPPPTAFRDTTPISYTTPNFCYQEFPEESVVTNPQLFEKLQQVRDAQEDQSELTSVTSVTSEEDKPILSTLTLETLEKRRSLVYNRELSTSLRNAQNSEPKEETKSSMLLHELEAVINDVHRPKKDISRRNSYVADTQRGDTLPNFKITTYNNPKEKISIFEDDSIRSNTENHNGKSTESIHRKNSLGSSDEDGLFKKPPEFGKYKSGVRGNFFKRNENFLKVIRSESFSNQNGWKPINPVKRSKSQHALNKPELNSEPICKSNSLYDVSGLQSLEVMRMIQSKLSTPSNSTETLDEPQPEKPYKTYQYRGPPSINLSTWSERPKTKVALKEDADYKINNVPNTNGNVKINAGNDPIRNQKFGNVVIRIGNAENPVNDYTSKFHANGNTVTYRKPLGNVNKITARPHSMSFASEREISRVPIVRAVELKKPFQEPSKNTTVTQINGNDGKYADLYRSTESINELKDLKPQMRHSVYVGTDPKPVIRVNSFQARVAPVVLGFQHNENIAGNRKSWNVPHYTSLSQMKAPETAPKMYTPNSNVPFSQSTLRRTEFKNLKNESAIPKPVPPPMPPKCLPIKSSTTMNAAADPRAQLLDSIRSFGGKGGLRSVQV